MAVGSPIGPTVTFNISLTVELAKHSKCLTDSTKNVDVVY